METVSVIVPSILPSRVADRAVNISPFGQPCIDVVFIREYLRTSGYCCSNQRLDGDLFDVLKHSDHDLTRPLDDTQNRRFFLLQGATPSGAFQTVSSPFAPFFLTTSGSPRNPSLFNTFRPLCPKCPKTGLNGVFRVDGQKVMSGREVPREGQDSRAFS